MTGTLGNRAGLLFQTLVVSAIVAVGVSCASEPQGGNSGIADGGVDARQNSVDHRDAGADTGGTDNSSDSGNSTNPPDSTSTEGDTGPDSGTPNNEPQSTPVCLLRCQSHEDCGQAAEPYTSDNYRCSSGACEYQGCLNDGECTGLGAGYVCSEGPTGFPTCLRSCSTADDCAHAGDQYGADNYNCDAGVCRYLGCNADAECASLGDSYACADAPSGFPLCQLTCQTAADCASAPELYDENNFECRSGICRYLGCLSDSECSMGLNGDYLCRESR